MMKLNNIDFPLREGSKVLLVAGPCSAESEEQVMETARLLAAAGVKMFRAGIWKPRTKPGCFEGVGEKGLPWLVRVQRELGMKVTTEVATAHHVEAALKAGLDYLWVGARTTVNPFAVQEIANALTGVDIPVFVKNPVNPDLELWIGALERLSNAGITRLAAIHRGFSSYEKKLYRNPPQWQIPIELRRRFPSLPIFCDPSHMAGRRDLVPELCQQALDLGFDGLFVESHCNPGCALSDAAQQLLPADLIVLMGNLVVRQCKEDDRLLEIFRRQIDEYDETLIDLLAKRMKVSREIARLKREHNITVLQTMRYNEIIEKRAARGASMDIDAECVKKIFEAIHTESVQQQLRVMEGEKKS